MNANYPKENNPDKPGFVTISRSPNDEGSHSSPLP